MILSLKKLKKLLNRRYPIKIILSPRTLSKDKNDENKMIVYHILKTFPDAKIMLPKDYINIIKIKKKNFLPYVEYIRLINYFNDTQIHHNQYATVDQYNIFADLNSFVEPFLFKNDKNQIEYKKEIKQKRSKKESLTSKIIDNL